MKFLIYDPNNEISNKLSHDKYQLFNVSSENELIREFEQDLDSDVVILDYSMTSESFHLVKSLRNKKASLNLVATIFSTQEASEVRNLVKSGLYDLYCGELINDEAIINIVDVFDNSLDDALKRKPINIEGHDKTSSQILNFDIFEDSLSNLENESSSNDHEIKPNKIPKEETTANLSKSDGQLEKKSPDTIEGGLQESSKEKSAYNVLENVIKKAIGFSKNNQKELETQEKRNQEMEDLFGPENIGGDMSDNNKKDFEDNTKEPNLSNDDLNLSNEEDQDGSLNIDQEVVATETVAGEFSLEDLDDGTELDLESVEDDGLSLGDDGIDLELGNDAELDLGDDGTALDLDNDESIELSADSMEIGEIELDGDSENSSTDLDISFEEDGEKSFENVQSEADEVDFSFGDDEGNEDFSVEESDEIDFTVSAVTSAEDIEEDSSDGIEGMSSDVIDQESDEPFLADSDETGDIDLDEISKQDIPIQNEIEGDNVIGEEFDYKTSMISADELKMNVEHENSQDEAIEPPFEDNEGFSISSEKMKSAHYDSDELMQAKAVMETMRSQRDRVETENKELKKQILQLQKEKEMLKEESTEAKIEVSIYKQKYEKLRVENSDNQAGINDNLRIAEAKNRNLKAKIESMKSSFIVDKQSISKRERDLESKIELMEIDISSQLKSREEKILELKRKVETLEFNMETTLIQNQGLRENKKMLSERLRLVSESLRGAGRVLDESIDFDVMFDEEDSTDQAS